MKNGRYLTSVTIRNLFDHQTRTGHGVQAYIVVSLARCSSRSLCVVLKVRLTMRT